MCHEPFVSSLKHPPIFQTVNSLFQDHHFVHFLALARHCCDMYPRSAATDTDPPSMNILRHAIDERITVGFRRVAEQYYFQYFVSLRSMCPEFLLRFSS